MAQSRILLSTANLNNFIAQIKAKHLECLREVMAWLPFLKTTKPSYCTTVHICIAGLQYANCCQGQLSGMLSKSINTFFIIIARLRSPLPERF